MRGTQPKTVVPTQVVNFETQEEEAARLTLEEAAPVSPEEQGFADAMARRLKVKLRNYEKGKVCVGIIVGDR